ncbi:hypothetical protein ACLQ2R_17515 [Streptosporangium sp. DT93]|uniref:hypothetical protein n=1 Tax=Streptosporangium sp. DT93 TaxID=3393428 RepID=UPI003CE9B57C
MCMPCRRRTHFRCWARPDQTIPGTCACDCVDADGLTTEAAWLESARRAPAELAEFLREQDTTRVAGARP